MAGVSIRDFSIRIHQLMPEISRGFARLQSNEVYKGKITLPQLLVMELINKEGPVKMTVLACSMKVTTAAMTGIIQRLVRQRYAQRNYDKSDRRTIRIALTFKGVELLKRINEQRTQVVSSVFRQLSEYDRADYLRVMGKVKEILEKEENR